MACMPIPASCNCSLEKSRVTLCTKLGGVLSLKILDAPKRFSFCWTGVTVQSKDRLSLASLDYASWTDFIVRFDLLDDISTNPFKGKKRESVSWEFFFFHSFIQPWGNAVLNIELLWNTGMIKCMTVRRPLFHLRTLFGSLSVTMWNYAEYGLTWAEISALTTEGFLPT